MIAAVTASRTNTIFHMEASKLFARFSRAHRACLVGR